MGRALKVVGVVIGAVVLLLIVAGVAVSLYFDPNQYRGKLAELVEQKTGRDLEIAGDIELSLFPWVGVSVGEVRLGNAPGFGPEPFARVEDLEVRVKLLPLLRKEVEMDTVVLDGLRLNLSRNAAGESNWDDLAGAPGEKPAGQPSREPSAGDGLAGLAVGGIEVTDAAVTWDDAAAGRKVAVSDLRLASGALVPGEPFPLTLAFQVTADQPAVKGRVELESQVTVDPAAGRYAVSDGELTTDLEGPLFPANRLEAQAAFSASADLKADTAQVESLTLTAFGTRAAVKARAAKLTTGPDLAGSATVAVEEPKSVAELLQKLAGLAAKPAAFEGAGLDLPQFELSLANGTAQIPGLTFKVAGIDAQLSAAAKGLNSQPLANGELKVEPFVPRDTLTMLGIEVDTADPSALTKADLATAFTAGTGQAGVKDLVLRVDESTVTGSASARRFQAPIIRYQLKVDAIDVDRYLPPPSDEAQPAAPATPAGAAAAGAAQLPVETLRRLDIEGTVQVGRLKAANLHSSDVRATLVAKDGLFQLQPATARLYEGSYQGNMAFDVRQQTPRIRMNEKLTGVQAGPLLEDLMGKAHVTGTAEVSADVNARGLDPEQVKKSLNGSASFRFRDGAVSGINIAQMLRKALAATGGGEQAAGEDETKQTDFAVLEGTLDIKDGLVRNDDLSAKSPLLRIEGAGTANLVSEQLDYGVKAAIVGTLEGQGGKELQQLKGLTIPIRIKGTFSEPKFSVELGKVLEERARKEVEGRVEEEKKKLEKRLDEQLQDKLKGFFR